MSDFKSAKELYEHDSTFRRAIYQWVNKKWCDSRLGDYLRDHDLLSQAMASDWASSCPKRPTHRMAKELGIKTKSHIYPAYSVYPACNISYYWITDDNTSPDEQNGKYEAACYVIPFLNIKESVGSHNNTFDNCADCLIWLLDAWEDANEGTPAKFTKCHKCEHDAFCTFTYDPFLADVHGEYTEPRWWCVACYETQCDEI